MEQLFKPSVIWDSILAIIPNIPITMLITVIAGLLGLLFGYAALYTLVLCRQSYVCVTNRQVYCRRVHPLGGRGRLQAIPLNRIAGAKLCRVAAAWQRQYSGDLLLTLTDGSSRMLPLLQNGQFVLDTIHEACSQHAVEKREQAGPDAPSAGISR